MNIKYVRGDATAPQGTGPRVITHCVNDVGQWGSGFVLAVSKRWKAPEMAYRAWHRSGYLLSPKEKVPFELGRAQIIAVDDLEGDLYVANVIGQHKNIQAGEAVPIRYEALEKGLMYVGAWCKERGASMHAPRLGAGLARGQWPLIEAILNRVGETHGIDITIYDLPV